MKETNLMKQIMLLCAVLAFAVSAHGAGTIAQQTPVTIVPPNALLPLTLNPGSGQVSFYNFLESLKAAPNWPSTLNQNGPPLSPIALGKISDRYSSVWIFGDSISDTNYFATNWVRQLQETYGWTNIQIFNYSLSGVGVSYWDNLWTNTIRPQLQAVAGTKLGLMRLGANDYKYKNYLGVLDSQPIMQDIAVESNFLARGTSEGITDWCVITTMNRKGYSGSNAEECQSDESITNLVTKCDWEKHTALASWVWDADAEWPDCYDASIFPDGTHPSYMTHFLDAGFIDAVIRGPKHNRTRRTDRYGNKIVLFNSDRSIRGISKPDSLTLYTSLDVRGTITGPYQGTISATTSNLASAATNTIIGSAASVWAQTNAMGHATTLLVTGLTKGLSFAVALPGSGQHTNNGVTYVFPPGVNVYWSPATNTAVVSNKISIDKFFVSETSRVIAEHTEIVMGVDDPAWAGMPRIRTNNIWAWYQPGVGQTNVSGLASGWQDASGLGHDLVGTGTKMPAITAADLDGFATLTFNGTSNTLKTALTTLNHPATVYMVCNVQSVTGTAYLLDGYTNASLGLRLSLTGPALGLNAGVTAPAVTITNGGWYILTAVFNGTQSYLKFGGAAITNATGIGANIWPNGVTLGSYSSQGTGWANFKVAEVLIKDVADSPTVQSETWGFWEKKYPSIIR